MERQHGNGAEFGEHQGNPGGVPNGAPGSADPHYGPQAYGGPEQYAAGQPGGYPQQQGQWGQPQPQQQYAQQPGQWAQPTQQWAPPPAPAKSSSAPMIAIAVALVALLAGGVWFLNRPSPPAQASVAAITAAPVAKATPTPTPKATPKSTPVPTVTKIIERTKTIPAPRERDYSDGDSYSRGGPGAKNCSSNSSYGRYTGVNVAQSGTTCGFARNVRRDYVNSGYSSNFMSYSPTTGLNYPMQCSRSSYVTCTGGNAAVIYIGHW